MLKERIFEEIDRQKERLCEMADTIPNARGRR